jgi:hypothetical protein
MSAPVNIIITINPHEDGVRCGECAGVCSQWEDRAACRMKDVRLYRSQQKRGPECLDAERKLREIVEAGNAMALAAYDGIGIPHGARKWDRAVAALEEK